MRSHDLARAILAAPDAPVEVSIDLSGDDETSERRAFGRPYCVQWDDATLTICAEAGRLNFKP